MEPMLWAGLIVATMAIATVAAYRTTGSATSAKGVLAGVSVAWTIWTYSAFFVLSAALYQFALIAFAAIGLKKLVDWIWSMDKEKKALEQALDNGLPASVIEVAVKEVTPNTLIKNDQHVAALYRAMTEARGVLVVSSGWASSSVVNYRFISALESALARGVEVTFIWGWEGNNSRVKPSLKQAQAAQALQDIYKKRRQKSPGRLHLRTAADGNHAKVILVDDSYAIIGSYNFLSNSRANKQELSVLCEDSTAIQETKQYFRDCIQHRKESQFG